MIGKIRHSIAFAAFAAWTASAGVDAGASSTLDDAIKEQLESGCDVLLNRGGTAREDLVGELQKFCATPEDAAPPPSAASGFAQASVATAPGIVQRRLRELREDEEAIVVSSEGASADQAVVDLGQRLSVFASGSYGALDKDRTRFEDGYDSDVGRFTVGGDYRIRSNLVAGLAFDYIRQDGKYRGPGDFDTSSYGVLGFAALAPTDRTYVQLVGEYLRNSHDRDRLAKFTEGTKALEGDASADYNSNLFYLSIGGAYRHPLGRFNIIPSFGVSWTRVEYESYSENGNSGLELHFEGNNQTSVLSTVGLTVSRVVNTEFAVLVPSAGIEWKHEFANDQRSADVSFVEDTRPKKFSYDTESPDRNFGVVSSGVVAVLPNGLQPFVNFQALVAHDFYESYTGLVGVRYSF